MYFKNSIYIGFGALALSALLNLSVSACSAIPTSSKLGANQEIQVLTQRFTGTDYAITYDKLLEQGYILNPDRNASVQANFPLNSVEDVYNCVKGRGETIQTKDEKEVTCSRPLIFTIIDSNGKPLILATASVTVDNTNNQLIFQFRESYQGGLDKLNSQLLSIKGFKVQITTNGKSQNYTLGGANNPINKINKFNFVSPSDGKVVFFIADAK